MAEGNTGGGEIARRCRTPRGHLGHNPALIIPAWRDFTDRFSGTGRPVRGIGEPIWATRQPEEIAEAQLHEAQLHEALLNVAVPPDVPLWLLCPYDTAALGEQVLAEAHRSHPVVGDSATTGAAPGTAAPFMSKNSSVLPSPTPAHPSPPSPSTRTGTAISGRSSGQLRRRWCPSTGR
jgi:hypothetical protein